MGEKCFHEKGEANIRYRDLCRSVTVTRVHEFNISVQHQMKQILD